MGPVKVTLSGPTEVVEKIKFSFDVHAVHAAQKLGGSMKITVSGYDVTFIKATFIEEALKYGFVHEEKLSNIMKKDFIVLSRQVKRY